MYQITDKISVGINKVTPRALIGLRELKLYDTELQNGDEIKTILNLFVDEEKLKKFLNLVFSGVPDLSWEDLDLAEVVKGYRDFFGQLSGNLT